jgi:recombination protein RecA
LDLALGGGWVLGRVSNVVGDKSTGKTLLAIEACNNFVRTYPGGRAKYRESEAAFDQPYAGAIGMPLDRVDFGDPDDPFETVEQLQDEVDAFTARCEREDVPGLFVCDSLDALSSASEKADKDAYGTAKPRVMSELFRKLVRRVERSRVHLMIISQVRDDIGAMFGNGLKRSGGHALDFYATHVVWLTHLKTLTAERRGVRRATGIRIKAKVDKNKVAMPKRDCEFDIIFGFGIDDILASLDWIRQIKRWKDIGIPSEEKLKDYMKDTLALSGSDYLRRASEIGAQVQAVWMSVERDFLPDRSKYGG